jgi:hypothetical protein
MSHTRKKESYIQISTRKQITFRNPWTEKSLCKDEPQQKAKSESQENIRYHVIMSANGV